jgi:hypothetical protein
LRSTAFTNEAAQGLGRDLAISTAVFTAADGGMRSMNTTWKRAVRRMFRTGGSIFDSGVFENRPMT